MTRTFVHNRIAANTLRRMTRSTRPEVAKQARRVLSDPKLFAEFAKVQAQRLDRRARRDLQPA